jgi:hypothetical protein
VRLCVAYPHDNKGTHRTNGRANQNKRLDRAQNTHVVKRYMLLESKIWSNIEGNICLLRYVPELVRMCNSMGWNELNI